MEDKGFEITKEVNMDPLRLEEECPTCKDDGAEAKKFREESIMIFKPKVSSLLKTLNSFHHTCGIKKKSKKFIKATKKLQDLQITLELSPKGK